jgi:ribonuclease G
LKQEIVINCALHETRIALIENDKLVELLVERPGDQRLVGAIYKGKVAAVLPGMQAAFLELGLERTAFLHISDVGTDSSAHKYDFEYEEEEGEVDNDIIRKAGRQSPIEDLIQKDQEILVQVTKEPLGDKGARVSTAISIPGRFLVLVPNERHIRVSRRIQNWAERKRLRRMLLDMRPEGFGFIVRTEGEGKQEKDFQKDIRRLVKIWYRIRKTADKRSAPCLLHNDAGITTSIIRDFFTAETAKVIIDSRDVYKEVISFVKMVAPALRSKVEFYKGKLPIFDLYGIEDEIDRTLNRKIWIRKGSFIVIDQTEALWAIDVNTGRFVGKRAQEETIYQTNMEAAREIARQIRLRDIGGLIIVDFIDMANRTNRKKVFEEFKANFANDRAKNAINPITEFGLIEMTRERTRPSLIQTFSEPCPTCNGFGRILSEDTIATKIERWFQRARTGSEGRKFKLVVNPEIAKYLSNPESRFVKRVSKEYRFKIELSEDPSLSRENYRVLTLDDDLDVTDLFKTKAEVKEG